MEPQEGSFNNRKHTLSLDLKSNHPPANTVADTRCSNDLLSDQKTPLDTALEITSAQKQYAQGFFDALRSVHSMNNFEFDHKKTLLSPGLLVPLVATHSELASPYATTPTNQRDLCAIIQAMVGTPVGPAPSATIVPSTTVNGISPFNVLPGPSLTGHSLPPSTSEPHHAPPPQPPSQPAPVQSNSKTTAEPPVEQRPEVKQEPMYLSEDSTDNMSERSRSSSVALSQTQGSVKMDYEMSMDDQERKKLERKRARNRAAASKCRQKKMDRIQELETQVSAEKQRGQSLDSELQRLSRTLQQLQTLMERHQQIGCPQQQMS